MLLTAGGDLSHPSAGRNDGRIEVQPMSNVLESIGSQYISSLTKVKVHGKNTCWVLSV